MLIFTLVSFKAFKHFGLNISVYIQYFVYVSLLCSVLSTFRLYCIIFIFHTCVFIRSCILTLVPLLDLVSLMQILLVFWIGCVLDMQLIFYIDLNCIACPDDHLLAKCSLQSFFNVCSCLIKISSIVYILFITLIAFYLLLYVPCIQLVIRLMEVLFVCEYFRIQVYTCKCFTTSSRGVSEFCHYSQTHV